MAITFESTKTWPLQRRAGWWLAWILVLFTVVLGGVLGWVMTARYERTLTSQGLRVVEGFAQRSVVGLLFEAGDTVRADVASIMAFPNIVYGAVVDARGKLLAESGDESRWRAPSPVEGPPMLGVLAHEDATAWQFVAPVYSPEVDVTETPFEQSPAAPRQYIGFVQIALSKAPVTAFRNQLFATLAATILVLSALLFGLLLRLSNWVLLPVRQLGESMAGVGDGSTGVRTPLGGPREMIEMGVAFNRMMELMERRGREVQESEVRFRTLFDEAGDLIHIVDRAGRILDANQTELAVMGYDRVEYLGMSLAEVLHPEYIGRIMAAIGQAFAGRAVENVETVVRSRDGTERVVENSITPEVIAGEVRAVRMIGRDVTARKTAEEALRRSEARLAQAQEIARIGSFEWRPGTGAVIASTQLRSILGVPDEQPLAASPHLLEWVHPEDRAAVVKQWQSMPLPGQPAQTDASFRIVLPDHTVRDISVVLRWREDSRNGQYYLLGVVQDITQARQVERTRQELERQLQHSQKMQAIGQLTGGIAHDFNNILGSILGYAGLARDRFAKDPSVKLYTYLSEILQAGERARDLVAQMMAFSRGGTIEPKVMSVHPIVGEAVRMLRATLPATINVDLDLNKELPPVLIDPVQLQQVVMNLCINARDAMNGGGQLTVALSKSGLSDGVCTSCHQRFHGSYVELVVADTGSGISAETLARIFEPFFTTKELGKGTGMGLAMVHGIVHAHHGHIVVESSVLDSPERELRRGTRFRVLLPMANQSAVVQAAENRDLAQTPITERAHILVVDDESAVAGFLKEFLETEDCRVDVETRSVHALQRFTEAPDAFDLVITDQTMPELTGAEMAKAMLALRPALPVILCTGYSETIDERKAKAIGIRHFFAKPVDYPNLARLVQRELAGRVVKH